MHSDRIVGKQKTLNIIDMIRVDHLLMLEEIKVIKRNDNYSSSSIHRFIDRVTKHADAEQELIHRGLDMNEEFHFLILEDQIEHRIINFNICNLKKNPKFRDKLKMMKNLKKICELIEQHIFQEEEFFLPILLQKLDQGMLVQLGEKYKKYRKFSLGESRLRQLSLEMLRMNQFSNISLDKFMSAF